MRARGSFVVGIAGGSASGKTTFAAALTRALTEGDPPLRTETFALDRYFFRGAPGGPTLVLPSTGGTVPDNNHPDSADNARLIADLDARRRAPDAPDVLLVEGLMTLHVAEIRDRCDLRLFIDLPADLRALRRLLRGMKEADLESARRQAAYYVECARVGHERYVEPSRVFADLILRGDADTDRSAALIAKIVGASPR